MPSQGEDQEGGRIQEDEDNEKIVGLASCFSQQLQQEPPCPAAAAFGDEVTGTEGGSEGEDSGLKLVSGGVVVALRFPDVGVGTSTGATCTVPVAVAAELSKEEGLVVAAGDRTLQAYTDLLQLGESHG